MQNSLSKVSTKLKNFSLRQWPKLSILYGIDMRSYISEQQSIYKFAIKQKNCGSIHL